MPWRGLVRLAWHRVPAVHCHVAVTVKIGYNDTPVGTPKMSLFAICHYIRSWDLRPNMHIKMIHNEF